jgi:predicted ester cyclase
MTDVNENKALVLKHLLEAVYGHRPELWDEIMDEQFDLHHPVVGPGRSNYEAACEILWAGFPDLRVEIHDVVAEADRVAVRYTERGTHLGDFMGIPPTGKSYEKHGFTLYRVANGRLAEAWFQEDDLGFHQQLFG